MFRVIAATQEMSSNAAPSMISISPGLLFCLIERSLKGSRSDRPLSRTENRGDSPCARKEKKNSSRNDTGDMPVQAELSALIEQCRTALRNRAEDVERGETSYPKARPAPGP